MNKPGILRFLKAPARNRILKGLLLYALFPLLCLVFLAPQIGNAVRNSDSAAFLVLLAVLGAVAVNWLAYSAVHRKRPALPVLTYGVFCLLLTAVIECEALPGNYALAPTLALIGGCLALVFLLLLSYLLASRRSRPAHAAAVGLWVVVGLIAFFMGIRVIRDIEARNVTRDTWITAAILVVLLLAVIGHRFFPAFRRAASRRRATGVTAGRIIQLIGETRLDRDDDLVTDYHARIQYSVSDADYEIRAGISRLAMRRFGKEAFVGREIPVHYDPESPADAYADRIDSSFFRGRKDDAEDSCSDEQAAGGY